MKTLPLIALALLLLINGCASTPTPVRYSVDELRAMQPADFAWGRSSADGERRLREGD
jgi:hypothetical protein